jgi:hypothetical protein
MRYWVFALFSVFALWGQPRSSTTRTYTFDANGGRQLSSEGTAGNGSSVQSIRNLNGGLSPIEKVEERILRDDASGRVVERIIRPYDASGQPGPPQRLQIEERKHADGTKSIETQVYYGNLNGGFSLAEKTTAVVRTAGNVETIETQVARPTLNGTVELIERKQARIETGDKSRQELVTVERRDSNGNFLPALREVKQVKELNGKTVENSTQYIAGSSGQLQLNGQSVAETQKRPDGTEIKQITIFGMSSPGRANSDQPQLREQQIIEKKTTNGQTVESLSIRRPAVDNPANLGPAQKISETVCTGTCK